MKLTDILNESPQREVGEGGFSRVMTTMRGAIPKIKTIGILTAENPCAQKLTSQENNVRNAKLEKILGSYLFGYRKVKGKYGNMENSFLVNNITKSQLMQLGDEFVQESIIFGDYFEEGEKFGMLFSMIRTHTCDSDEPVGTIMGQRKVFIDRNNEDDFYSEIKGRRFQIPFFEVPTFDDKDGTITKKPFEKIYDTHYDDAEFDGKGGEIKGSYRTYPSKSNAPDKLSDEDKEKIEKLNEQSLDESKTLKSQWEKRGRIMNILNKYM